MNKIFSILKFFSSPTLFFTVIFSFTFFGYLSLYILSSILNIFRKNKIEIDIKGVFLDLCELEKKQILYEINKHKENKIKEKQIEQNNVKVKVLHPNKKIKNIS